MSKPNVFLIIGKSFSGKDTAVNMILDNKEFCKNNNIEKLVRYTTREKRPYEVDGKDYYFIDNEVYQKYFENSSSAVTTTFNSEFGKLHYITDFSRLEPNKNYILTGDPNMIEPFKEKLDSFHLCIIYLITPNWKLMSRWHDRNDNEKYSDKKWKEIGRRYSDDLLWFGLHSNKFVANTNNIINLGDELFIDKIMDSISEFIKTNEISQILSKDGVHKYFNKYNTTNSYICTSLDYNNLVKGDIYLWNGNIVLNSEDSSIVYYVV